MNWNLEGFGATLVVGAYLLLGFAAVLFVFKGCNPYKLIDNRRQVFPGDLGALALGLCLAAGMLMEDVSNIYVDELGVAGRVEPCWVRRTPLSWVSLLFLDPRMPSEGHLRADALYNRAKLKGTSLGRLVAELGGTPADTMDHANCRDGTYIAEDLLRSKRDCLSACEAAALEGYATKIYYYAKNTVYAEETYYDDMQQVQIRIDFARSFAVTSLLLFGASLILLAIERFGSWCRRTERPELTRIAKRRRWLVVVLSYLFFVGGRFVFAWEEVEYDKLAFGYFTTLQQMRRDTVKPSQETQGPAAHAKWRSASVPNKLGYSGMAELDARCLLVVHDTKVNESGPRMGVLTVGDDDGSAYSPVCIDWGHERECANDLESLCKVPGRTHEYLAAESQYWKGKYGRIFHFRLSREKCGWGAKTLNVIPLPRDTVNVEGIACAARKDGSYLLILAERGGDDGNPQGQLRWGTLDLDNARFALEDQRTFEALDWPKSARNRDCADLYLDTRDNNRLWIVATEDSSDVGPFRSVIYDAGLVAPGEKPPIRLRPTPVATWHIDGFKVEGLGPGILPKSKLSIATEDESYGGTWRPLFAHCRR